MMYRRLTLFCQTVSHVEQRQVICFMTPLTALVLTSPVNLLPCVTSTTTTILPPAPTHRSTLVGLSNATHFGLVMSTLTT